MGFDCASLPSLPWQARLGSVGFWDHLFDDDYKQRDDIESLKVSAGSTARSTGSLERRVGQLADRLGRLELTVQGVYRVLEEQGSITNEQFRELLVQVDLEDGREDGRVGPDRSERAPKCPSCARPISRKRTSCVFCGAELPKSKPRRRGVPGG